VSTTLTKRFPRVSTAHAEALTSPHAEMLNSPCAIFQEQPDMARDRLSFSLPPWLPASSTARAALVTSIPTLKKISPAASAMLLMRVTQTLTLRSSRYAGSGSLLLLLTPSQNSEQCRICGNFSKHKRFGGPICDCCAQLASACYGFGG